MGSSPLTRGKLVFASDGETELGLIPAHAGKTGYDAAISARIWAHPRSRGENAMFDSARSHCPGSSPLTRGKRSRNGERFDSLGLIPAHAGKTMRSWIVVADEGAHPRSRGENM